MKETSGGNYRIPASTGMGICAATLLLYSRIGENTSVLYIMIVMCITGKGFALFSSPNTNTILSCVKKIMELQTP